jgi:hypothetical protein
MFIITLSFIYAVCTAYVASKIKNSVLTIVFLFLAVCYNALLSAAIEGIVFGNTVYSNYGGYLLFLFVFISIFILQPVTIFAAMKIFKNLTLIRLPVAVIVILYVIFLYLLESMVFGNYPDTLDFKDWFMFDSSALSALKILSITGLNSLLGFVVAIFIAYFLVVSEVSQSPKTAFLVCFLAFILCYLYFTFSEAFSPFYSSGRHYMAAIFGVITIFLTQGITIFLTVKIFKKLNIERRLLVQFLVVYIIFYMLINYYDNFIWIRYQIPFFSKNYHW